MRSVVYVDSNIEESPQFGHRKISAIQPVVLHVSKTIIATDSTTNSQSTWVNLPINCPGRCNSIFTYTARDIKNVLNPTQHLNGELNSISYSLLLELFRSTLDQFCSELQRFVGPFVKCSRRDVNVALTVSLFYLNRILYHHGCLDISGRKNNLQVY
jgi:hypothetical protein